MDNRLGDGYLMLTANHFLKVKKRGKRKTRKYQNYVASTYTGAEPPLASLPSHRVVPKIKN